MRLPALLLISLASAAAAQDDLVVRGYQHFYNLQYDQALADFRRYQAQAPSDPNAFNHVAEGVLYRDMFRAGALETELVTKTRRRGSSLPRHVSRRRSRNRARHRQQPLSPP